MHNLVIYSIARISESWKTWLELRLGKLRYVYEPKTALVSDVKNVLTWHPWKVIITL